MQDIELKEHQPQRLQENLSLEAAVDNERESVKTPKLPSRFEVVEQIGQGGMGTVFKVRDRELKKTFAVKLINPDLLHDKIAVQRFQQEANGAIGLTHPNLVAVYGHDTTTDGCPFILMDFEDGVDLGNLLKNDGFLNLNRFLNIATQVCEALSHAHWKGVIHRDVKPSNILIKRTPDGTEFAKVVDFGIAKVMASLGATSQSLTSTGVAFGSPIYMSPEQCRAEKLDFRTDVYSMGCLMFEMLTGKPPYHSETPLQTMIQHISADLPHFSRRFELPETLERVVLHCLEKNANDRYQTMEELRKDLENVREGRPVSVKKKPLKKADGDIAIKVAAVSAPLVVLALAAAVFFGSSKSQSNTVVYFTPQPTNVIQPQNAPANPLADWKIPKADPSDVDGLVRRVAETEHQLENFKHGNRVTYLPQLYKQTEQITQQSKALLLEKGNGAIPVLVGHIADREPSVRKLCYDTLKSIKNLDVQTLVDHLVHLDRYNYEQFQLVDALGIDGTKALIGVLRYKNPSLPPRAMAYLANQLSVSKYLMALSPSDVSMLTKAMATNKDPMIRASIANFAAPLAISDQSVKAMLVSALSDSDADVRLAAVSALGAAAHESSLESATPIVRSMKAMLNDDESSVRFAAMANIAALGPDKAQVVRDSIEAAKQDSNRSVALAAAFALAEMTKTKAVPAEFLMGDRELQAEFRKRLSALNEESPAVEFIYVRDCLADGANWGSRYHNDIKSHPHLGIVLPVLMRQAIKDGRASDGIKYFKEDARTAIPWVLIGAKGGDRGGRADISQIGGTWGEPYNR